MNSEKIKKQWDRSTQIILAFLLASIIILSALIYFSTLNKYTLIHAAESLSRLDETFKKSGLNKFLEEKNLLKQKVAQAIKTDIDSPEATEALNIAVFLFPEILPDDNFEKDESQSLWITQQKAIESAPHSRESRIQFEHMRANIWNYENPDRDNPWISSEASKVIQIYNTISSPQ